MDRKVIEVSSLSLSFSDYLFIYPSIYLSTYLSIYLSIYLDLFIYLSIYLSYCACHGKCIFADPLQMPHACLRFWKCHKTLTFYSLLRRCTIPCACHAKRHLNLQKWRVHVVLCTFWLRNVLRATTACTFSTSQLPKVVPSMCVLYVLTFAPQRRALFRHLNFQKWSENGVFCTFKLRNVLHAATACNFSSLIWPAGSAPAAYPPP